MSSRIAQLALYWIAFSTLAIAAGLPQIVALILLLSGLAAVLIRQAGVRYGAEAALVVVAGVTLKSGGAALFAALMGAAALNAMLPGHLSPNRPIGIAIAGTTIADFIKPWAAWTFIPVIALSLWTLLGANEAHPSTARHRLNLAGGLALVSALLSVAAGFLAGVIPWQRLLGGLFAAVTYPFVKVATNLRPFHIKARKNPFKPSVRHIKAHPLPASPPNHAVLWIMTGLVSLLVLAAIIYFGRRYWTESLEPVEAETGANAIIRETLADEEVVAGLSRRRERLTPVRHFVRRRHQLAAEKRIPGETLREWVQRTGTDVPDKALRIYEEVRYGNQDDTRERRHTIEKLWRT
ncbi:hypothetical protein [Sulfobacillus harzensis]|uniref:DUF4129 domain-containing protein n=1 Tax=Sulfobacillus harzensis TaxID=2729629 RepID=A0A7Y0L4R1_9FIRM|nr:hypothetical protein [Sulfobacillus harzensis]NMP23200.1 hypothetical protein [Sulfobacillus harzensis]